MFRTLTLAAIACLASCSLSMTLGGPPKSAGVAIPGTSARVSMSSAPTQINPPGGGTGTVTSVVGGTGISGGTITTTGTLAVDPTVVQTRVSSTCTAGNAIRVIAQDGTVTCQAASGGAGITNSAGANVIMKSDGTNATPSSLSDDTTNVTTAEHVIVNSDLKITTGTGPSALISTKLPVGAQGFNLFMGDPIVGLTGTTGTLASFNTSVGIQALAGLTNGNENVAVGYQALKGNTTGTLNTAVGYQALAVAASKCCSTAVGYLADSGAGANAITAIGYSAAATVTGTSNTAIGANAMSAATSGADNTAVGYQALQNNTTGITNNAFGENALQLNNIGSNNTAVGFNSMALNQSGATNTAVGVGSLEVNVSNSNSAAFGYRTLLSSIADNESAFGTQALANVTTGANNTAIGVGAGGGITTGANNTILGPAVGLAGALANAIVIADGAGHALWLSNVAPTSASHGAFGTGSTNSIGNVTGVGAFTSTVVTFSGTPWPNRSWCFAQPNSTAVSLQTIVVTNSSTAPTFSCFTTSTAAAANCNDFTYYCGGN